MGRHSVYPSGFGGGVLIRNKPHIDNPPGKVFYVGNNATLLRGELGAVDANSNDKGGEFLRPFASIDYAIGQCVANRGDIIYVRPNHSVTISAADAIDIDVAGVSIIGLGNGKDRPIILFDNTAATVAIDAANVLVHNLELQSTITVVVKGLDIKDGADDFHLSGLHFSSETLATDEFEDSIFITTADRGLIEDCVMDMDEQADADSAIHLSGICLGMTIRNNVIMGDYTVACIESVGTAQEQLIIEDNVLINGVHANLNTVACISLLTATTGYIHDNILYTNVSSPLTGAIVADACFLGENTVSTTAETFPLKAEDSGNRIMKSVSATALADETSGATIFTVTGTVDVHSLVYKVETASDSEVLVGCDTDCTDETLNETLMTTTIFHETAAAVGDTGSSTTAGGALVATEVPGDLSPIWTSPARVTPGVIELTKSGTSGALVMGVTVYFSPVSSDGEIA